MMNVSVEQPAKTIEEFEKHIAQPENADRLFELINGEIIEKLPTQLHAYIISMINYFLVGFVLQKGLGSVLIEARYRHPDHEDNDFIPDLSFITKERGDLVRSGPAPYMPDLAVEAQSEGQSDKFMLDKAQLYIKLGVRMVWIIYSTREIIEVLTPTTRQLLTVNDSVTGGDVLPGFEHPVRDFFPKPTS